MFSRTLLSKLRYLKGKRLVKRGKLNSGETMKLKAKRLIILLLAIFMQAKAENFRLSYETISSSMIKKESKYEKLRSFTREEHRTIITIPELPEPENYILKWKRPLFGEIDNQCEILKMISIFTIRSLKSQREEIKKRHLVCPKNV